MKKLIATILTIVMLTGIAGVVPAFADEWTPTSSDDGYTKVLADYDMESLNGITGTQKISDPGFESGAFNTTTDWTSSSDAITNNYATIVSAANASLPDAAAHGYVVKHTGAYGGSVTAGNNTLCNASAVSGNGNITKAVVQVDMYIDEMVNNYIEVLSANGCDTGGANTVWKKGTIRFMNGGTIKACIDGVWADIADVTFQTKKWYTVTVAYDISSTDNRTFSVWLDKTRIVNNEKLGGDLASCEALKHFNLYMSWNKGAVDAAPTVYWDNMRVYTGDISVSGSPRYADTEILGATAIASPIDNDGHGKVLEVAGGTYFVKAFTNPIALDDEYALVAPTDAKIAEYGQVKLEADVYLPEDSSRAKVGVRYVNGSGAEADLDLVALDSYDKAKWHTVVVYITRLFSS